MSWSEADLAALPLRGDARVVGLPLLPDETPEGTLLAEIRKVANAWRWLTYHSFDSRKSDIGFPDLVLCNGVSLLIMELKTNTGKLTKEQALWLSMLAHTEKVESGVWRPNMWNEIVQRLSRPTR